MHFSVFRIISFFTLQGLSVKLRLKRRHLFYTVFVVCPNLILYSLSGLSFLLPTDSGEKVSFSVTLVLAQMVSFGTLTSIFPASSLNFPLLAYFVLVVTLHMSILCFCAVMGKLYGTPLFFARGARGPGRLAGVVTWSLPFNCFR